MTDEQLHRELAQLGVDRDTWRAVLLLPVVQVAWADGEVQTAEKARILEMAHAEGLLDGPGGDVVRRWLERPPDAATLARGRRVLVALVQRHRGPGADLDDDALEQVEARCLEVARAAGGLFDLVFTVDESEQKALRAISTALGEARQQALDDLPSPDGGSFTDL